MKARHLHPAFASRRASRPAIGALVLLVAGAWSVSAAPARPLTPEETRKIAPLLAVAAEPLADTDVAAASALPAELSPVAAVMGARVENGVPVADLLLEVPGGDTRALAELGLQVDAVVGDVATARSVPLSLVDDLARHPAVARLQAASRLRVMNDASVPETGAPGVWTDPFNATGRGVIVGIIDTGIDVNHPDFENPDGTTRVRFLLDLSQPGSGPYGGTLFSAAQINAGAVAPDIVGHGTHIAGSAAGGGRADAAFRGVAPEADLVIVNADRSGTGAFTDVDIVNSLAFIDQKAAELGLPYVVNLSLGGHIGAHDGTLLQETAIDNLVGAGKAGKAIVIAAGNERANPPQHAEGTVGQNGIELRFTIPEYTPNPGSQNDFVLISMWFETFSDFSFRLVTPNGYTLGPFALGQSNGASGTLTSDGLIAVQNAISGANPANGDFEAYVLVLDTGTVLPASGIWRILITDGVGPFDAYIAASTTGASFANYTPNPAAPGLVSEPGTARNAITVGAYMTKIEWVDKDGHTFQISPPADFGRIAPFSNAGPTRDGRRKPEICAPGQEIASCYSVDAPPGSPSSTFTSIYPQYPNMFILAGDRYAIQQGTSQAAPHVAGAVALLFELHPDWDIFDVKRVLTSTARADNFTGPVPNNIVGFGKLDVLAAAQVAAPDTILAGDVDGNGILELADVLLTLDLVLDPVGPTAEERERADINRDDAIDVGDLVLVVRAVAEAGPQAPEPSVPAGSETWMLPVAIEAEKPVVAIELEMAPGIAGVHALGRAVRAVRPGVIAAGAAAAEGATRIVALAADRSSLAGGSPILFLPFAVPPGRAADVSWHPRRIDLVGSDGTRVAGTVAFGPPEPGAPAAAAPAVLRVWPVAPNPLADPARIAFAIPGSAKTPVTVGIYDVTGRLVMNLAGGMRAPGRHEINWDGRGGNGQPLAAGVYWVRVTAGGQSASARLTVVR